MGDELVSRLLGWQGEMPDALKADLREAADRIEALQQRVKQLEEGLKYARNALWATQHDVPLDKLRKSAREHLLTCYSAYLEKIDAVIARSLLSDKGED